MTNAHSAMFVAIVTALVLTGGAAYALGGIGRAVLFAAPVLCGVLVLNRTLSRAHLPDTRLCSACGFDLRGSVDERGRCPECGSDLSVRGAVRPAQRVGLAWRIAAGVLLILAPLVIAGAVAANRSIAGG